MAVEGESEQSFITWLQGLSEDKLLHIHLDCGPLGGGGFKSMLQKAVRLHQRRCRTRSPYQDRFLIVDGDRADQGDWSIEELRGQAAKHKFTVCIQSPNHEGLLLRMMPGMGREKFDGASAKTKLRSRWENYQKPVNAQALRRQFSIEDLLRVAKAEVDLGTFLEKIGLMRGP